MVAKEFYEKCVGKQSELAGGWNHGGMDWQSSSLRGIVMFSFLHMFSTVSLIVN